MTVKQLSYCYYELNENKELELKSHILNVVLDKLQAVSWKRLERIILYNYYKEKPGYYRNDIYVKGDRVLITENSLVKENNQVLRLQERSGVFTSNKKQLKNFFKDCAEAVAKTEQVKDIWYEMPSLVQAYNLCKKNKVFLP